ncbi:prolyl hydroxylase family protein [Sphingomonas pituitosa]|uniref:prolyl hydroxylase family protein n=1 Tax=Sphingomonas pituitosa TaxID=99597 RepID=UPI00082F4C5E|nr:2OG-Fe(II) oxygenase [Sphingomonas pituitosa]
MASDYSDASVDQLLQQRDVSAAVALVEKASAAGVRDACFRLAMWLLAGAPIARDLPRAIEALHGAALAGHADAALMEAALVANGAAATPDWARALQLLRAAADKANAVARQHLLLLDEMALSDAGHPLTLPAPEVLHDAPRIVRLPKLLTPAECEHLAMSAADLLQPAMVFDPKTNRMVNHPVRTSDNAVIGPTRESLVVQAILRRVAAATGTDVGQGEPVSLLRYSPGQQYRPHLDTINGSTNQRIKTVLLYLNEGFAGGETRFELLGIDVVARGGDALVFDNVLEDGRPDPRSRHAGLPVRAGAKWVATRWIRAAPYSPWDQN